MGGPPARLPAAGWAGPDHREQPRGSFRRPPAAGGADAGRQPVAAGGPPLGHVRHRPLL